MMTHTILVAEDDPITAELISRYLLHDHYRVIVARDGREAIDLSRVNRLHLVVLDLMLPKIDGLDVCRVLRAESRIPIIMVTARASEEDKLLGLDLGADDYVVKPFSPRELVARVRVVLRRAGQPGDDDPPVLTYGALTVDAGRHEACISGAPLALTPTEFRLLMVLAQSPGRVFSRERLLDRVFSATYDGTERTIDVHLMNLRRKLDKAGGPAYLHTVFGVGYRFEVPGA
jgi:DNA-binding response OmpR family regulator